MDAHVCVVWMDYVHYIHVYVSVSGAKKKHARYRINAKSKPNKPWKQMSQKNAAYPLAAAPGL